MTTIRRITTSQVEGDSANNTNTSEIRPFGETAFYIDNSGPTDKLTLMMFDGARTHLKSKVLAPGVLYGSNADSGDGVNLDTIKLIPDAELFNNGSDQYLIVDPTAPNHIHLRAGGTIDNSTADLYLGGENNHVRVSDSGFLTVKAANSVELNVGSSTYTFSYDQIAGSSLLIPGGIQGALQPSFLSSNGLGIVIDGFNAPNTVDIGNISSSTVLRLKDGVGVGNIVLEALGTSLKLQTNNNSTWEFNDNGSLTFPDASVQTTAYVAPTINTTAATAIALANTDTVNLELAGGRAYVLYKIQTSHAAWVRVYTSAAARTADASRSQGVDPGVNAGVVAEAITAGAETVVFAPAVNGFNDESPTTSVMPITVTNLSGTTNDITVTVTKLTLVA